MNYSLGVMQGRLLPKYQGRYQAHPVGYWESEFVIAKTLQLDLIEFILDFNDYEQNPLMTETGLRQIRAFAEDTGVKVKSICADFFMEAPLHSEDTLTAKLSMNVLRKLIMNASKIGVRDVVIPCVDQSSVKVQNDRCRLREALQMVSEDAERLNINLCLETDLAPEPFARLLAECNSSNVTVNYDTGNSASLGYNVEEELSAYGNRITDIHIKDRIRNGGSVLLGTGAVDFDRFFSELLKVKYDGPFIMQAYRDDEGVKVFKEQLACIKPKLLEWSDRREM